MESINMNPTDIEKLSTYIEAVKGAWEALSKEIEKAVEVIKLIGSWQNNVYSFSPSERVTYLALHHRKARIRNKNINRIIRNGRKWGNRSGSPV